MIDCKLDTGELVTIEGFSNFTRYREAGMILTHYPYPFALPGHEWDPPFFDKDMMPTRLAHQKWISFFVGEPLSMYPITSFMSYLYQYDLRIGEPKDLVDIYIPGQLFVPKFREYAKLPQRPRERRKDANVVWMASNCKAGNHRMQYVEELMKYIPVYSYGKCLNNIQSSDNNNTDSHYFSRD